MAITRNMLLQQLSGHIGRQLVIKQYGDKTVVTKFPDMSRRKLTDKQKQVNRTMSAANYYARGVIADETRRNEAQLRLNVTRNKLYTSLIREYFLKAKEKKRS